MTGRAAWLVAALLFAVPSISFAERAEGDTKRSSGGSKKQKRWRPQPPPRSANHARDPRVEKAMREAPGLPPRPAPYPGYDKAIKAARAISKRVPTFINFRAAITLATWRVDPAYEWRVRPMRQCRADLFQQKIVFRRYDPERDGESRPRPATAAGEAAAEEAEEEDPVAAAPTPVFLRAPINGVRFRSGRGGGVLISCELAARLSVMAEIVARHGVDQVVINSAFRPRPRTSFHTMGLALDISHMHLSEPQRGPNGRLSEYLNVETDFLETPDVETCDPSLFGPDSPLGDNERGRRLLAIACELHASGIFSSVLTPNYNPGHRDHFHIDIRPDDPRLFLR